MHIDLSMANAKQLLRWAIRRIEANADMLERSNYHHGTKRVEGVNVRREIAESRRWAQRTRQILDEVTGEKDVQS